MATAPSSEQIARSVAAALAEDVGPGDLTAALVPERQSATATIIAREAATLCGRDWVEEVFRQLGGAVHIDWQVPEAGRIEPGQVVCRLQGPARALLTGERTALNFLQLLSATASAARACVDAVAGTAVVILDTRKTLPGLRLAQKYAVRCGGAQNHRIGLFDAILIKENHIAAAGGIAPAVSAALSGHDDVMIEVEVETLEQTREALASGAHRLLLDNFERDQMRAAVRLRNQLNPSVTLEASGGMTRADLRTVAETGIDFISIGALTKNVTAVDLSMRFEFDSASRRASLSDNPLNSDGVVDMTAASPRYSGPAQFFHWLIAGLILFQIPLAYYMIGLPLSPDKLESYALHKSVGLSIFALSAMRLAWRWLRPPPPLAADIAAWQATLARLAQWLLYGIIFAMPLTGWLSSSAANFPVSLFGWVTLPNLVAPDQVLHEQLELAHRLLAYGLFTLLAAHVGAALHHHFLRRDHVLLSMLPGRRTAAKHQA